MTANLKVALLLIVAALRDCAHTPKPVEQAAAEAFQDACGLNVHLQYDDTGYASTPRVSSAARYVGCRHLRDSAFRRGDAGAVRYDTLARQGFDFDLFFNADLTRQLDRTAGLETRVAGAVASIEGPNEVNNDPVVWGGARGTDAALAYQAHLEQEVRRRPPLATKPVLNFTDWPPPGGMSGAVNVHTYARGQRSFEAQLRWDLRLSAAALPEGRPVYVTETGYTTASEGRDAVTLAAQAPLVLIALLEAYRAGVRRTYLYELLDEAAGPGSTGSSEGRFGLFDGGGRPKPVAVALHHLFDALKSSGGGGAIQPPLRVQGAAVRHLELARKDGVRVLLLWRLTGRGGATSVTAVVKAAAATTWSRIDLSSGSATPAGRASQLSTAVADAPVVLRLDPIDRPIPEPLRGRKPDDLKVEDASRSASTQGDIRHG